MNPWRSLRTSGSYERMDERMRGAQWRWSGANVLRRIKQAMSSVGIANMAGNLWIILINMCHQPIMTLGDPFQGLPGTEHLEVGYRFLLLESAWRLCSLPKATEGGSSSGRHCSESNSNFWLPRWTTQPAILRRGMDIPKRVIHKAPDRPLLLP